jgi:hypothetical protein
VGLAGSYHLSLRWPFLVCNRWSRCTATRPTNAAVKSARKPTSLSPAQANAASLGGIRRGHWAIENRLHHKRDTVLGEDACRTRKAAQSLAALRNLLLGFLHQLTTPVLRSVRSFSTNPMPLYRWLSGCIRAWLSWRL